MEDKDKFKNQDKIIRPWEELEIKRNKFGLGYDKTNVEFFNIPDYSKPVKFVSDGFLVDDLQRHTIHNKLDEVPKLDDHDEEQEDKDVDDATNDDEDDALDLR